MNRSTIGVIVAIIGLFSVSAFASWEVVGTSAEVVRADGVKAAAELGPARAAAVGHIDSDGVIDVVVGHAVGEAGAVAVYFGNEAFREGIKREMDRAARGEAPADPFMPEAVLFDLPFAPDWVAVGDFDSDAFIDVACAARARSELVWLSGDGAGTLAAPVSIALPGPVTTMASGDVNRWDALTDLVVAVETGSGGGILVFENPAGALAADPEWHPTSMPVTDVALGRLNQDGWFDIAAAAGDLVIVLGRDRQLGSTARKREVVPPALVQKMALDAPVRSLVFGDFSNLRGDQLAVHREDGVVEMLTMEVGDLTHREVAYADFVEGRNVEMVTAKTSYGSGSDLVVAREGGSMLELLGSSDLKSTSSHFETRGTVEVEAGIVVPIRLNRDARDDLVVFSGGKPPAVVKTLNRLTLVVNSTGDPGTGGVCDATECTLREAITTANNGPLGTNIIMNLPFVGATIDISSSGLPEITKAGVILDGTAGAHPFYYPVTINGSSCPSCSGLRLAADEITVTDTAVGDFDTFGFRIGGSDSLIEGCRAGIAGNGSVHPNQQGVWIEMLPLPADPPDGNTIGGTTVAARNIISGNTSHGIAVMGYYGVVPWFIENTIVEGNFVGTGVGGTTDAGNGDDGIYLQLTDFTRIGSGIAGGGNVICGSGFGGISGNHNDDFSWGELIVGNLIGVGADGNTGLPNANGVWLDGEDSSVIGGSNAAVRNVIAGNDLDGIVVTDCDSCAIQGNYVGLAADGETGLGNSTGIKVEDSSVTVGGGTLGMGNIVAANSINGIYVGSGATNIDILGNTVGTNADGDPGLGNSGSGIVLFNNTACDVGEIGNPEASNLVTANEEYGVWIEDGGSGHRIAWNRVGVVDDPSLGNLDTGIRVENAHSVWVFDNQIHHSGTDGIAVTGSGAYEVNVSGNVITSSGDLAIDLGDDGVTTNDPGDGDSGPNRLLNFPVLLTADPATGMVSGTLDTEARVDVYDVEFYENSDCSASGHGEAEVRLAGTADCITDATGHCTFSKIFAGGLTSGSFVSALVIDQDGNASELSACIEVETIAPQEITIEFVSGSLSISEGEPAAEIDIVMTTSDGEVSDVSSSVDYETYDDGAVAGQDYVFTSGTMLFPAGTASGTVQTVEVDLIDDILVEVSEDFVLELTNPTGAVIVGNNEFPVTILDNDSEPPIFTDGFESGDTSAWSSSNP